MDVLNRCPDCGSASSVESPLNGKEGVDGCRAVFVYVMQGNPQHRGPVTPLQVRYGCHDLDWSGGGL